jgi:predicted enzyme related to lactoylglutathione lyase
MRARDTSAGAPCWIDLATSGTDVARDFYTGLFGWTAEEPQEEFGGYFMFNEKPGGVPVAGCMPAMPDGAHDVWGVYLTVEDVAKTLESVTANGGQVIAPAMQVGEAGTMAVIADPGDAVIGLWQPDQFPGIAHVGEPGQPSWFELLGQSYDAQVDFYQEVFGWTMQVVADEPGQFRYSVLQRGAAPLAGIMDAGPDVTSMSGVRDKMILGWGVYFWTTDADATLARAEELGGKAILPAEDTPYGRLATVEDPCGARFRLMAQNDQMPAQ